MASALAKRLDDLEVKAKSMTGNLESTVYGIIDRVDRVDGVLVPNVIRCWEGEIGNMEPTDRLPDVFLVEKLESFILKHKKYKGLFGGRGGMKTRFAQNLFTTQVFSVGCKVYALRERMTSLKESIYSGIESTIKKNETPGYLSVPSQWEIRNNISNGKFVFGGMQNILDMKGSADFKYFLMEEAEKTKQATIDTLGPTLRDMPGAELWYLWNTASSQDAMSKEFITPYQADLDKYGIYEDDYHLIIKLTYKDNPWFEHDDSLRQELEKDRQKVEKRIMSKARFNGIWNGDFNDDCTTSVIQEDWFEACIDAHKKLGFERRGATVSASDPSDIGTDPFGYAARQGVVFFSIDEIVGENGNRKMDEACKRAIQDGCDSYGYDADGLGATLRDNVAAAFNGKSTNIYAYKGSESPHNPEGEFKSQVSNLNNNSKVIKVKDALKNKKAQNTISFADRVYRTYEAVVDGKYHDPDTLVSFDSETIKPEMLQKLKAEACKIPIKPGTTVQFYTKPEMRRGITMPDGKRMVIPSPNLFDSVIVAFDKDCEIISREEVPLEDVYVQPVNYW
jgi:phage terminase large subunit